ncbi:MAG: COX15/CtaA family protein [Gemmatimonadetes bacterium]|nr:COX15/CtaA family protein [Gemmatimonadota bacterium]
MPPAPPFITASHAAFLRRWMLASAAVVVLTLVIGGTTRLTESGLSITEWKPVSGVLPPLTREAWEAAFTAYQQIPEAQTVHRGISLEAFKSLFWWEWAHRIVARLAGLVMALPFLWLLARRQVPAGWMTRLAALPILTGAQGALGWYMVSSGLSQRTDVSQYRLVAHLGLALLIYAIAIWTWLDLRSGQRPGQLNRMGTLVAALAAATILSGGFVAGLDAGHIFNTFPLMGDGMVPPGYSQLTPMWRNWFENPAAVQFNHRVLATVTLFAALLAWWQGRAQGTKVMAVAALGQVALGITTLLMQVPIPIAALHQLGAVVLLTAALRAAHPATGHSSR